MLYFDNSTTTRPSTKVVQSIQPYLKEDWGSPQSPYAFGQKLYPAMEESLSSIRALFGAKADDLFIFASSGALAINQVIFSVFHDISRKTGKNHFLTTEIEEAPFIFCLNRLEELGCSTFLAPVNDLGVLTPELLADAITPRTALVSLSLGHGLIGTLQPIQALAALCQQRGIILHVDVSHAIGKMELTLDGLGAHVVTFRADTFHGLQGTAGIWIRPPLRLSPYVVGAPLDLPVYLMVATGKACQEAETKKGHLGLETARLRDLFETSLLEKLPECRPLFRGEDRLPHISCIAFPGISSEALLFALSKKGLAASMGGGQFQQLGLILKACKIDPLLAQCGLSFSFSHLTTEEEIEKGVSLIQEVVLPLRQLSLGVYPV